MSEPKWKPGDYCDRCNNTGEVDCRCGGDLCVCGQQEIECPQCHGLGGQPWDGDDSDWDQP